MPETPLQPNLMSHLVGYHCRRAFLAVEPFSDPRMAPYGLRPADFAVLSLLKANPHTSQKRVAQGIGVSPPNLAPVLDRLEARHLIMRKRSSADKRIHIFSLSERGLQLCEAAEKTALELENESSEVLSAEERRQLIGLLQKLYL